MCVCVCVCACASVHACTRVNMHVYQQSLSIYSFLLSPSYFTHWFLINDNCMKSIDSVFTFKSQGHS